MRKYERKNTDRKAPKKTTPKATKSMKKKPKAKLTAAAKKTSKPKATKKASKTTKSKKEMAAKKTIQAQAAPVKKIKKPFNPIHLAQTNKAKKQQPPRSNQRPKAKQQTPDKTQTGSSVIWKFLEMKEQRRRERQAQNSQQASRNTHQHFTESAKVISFARFAGPRRRSA